MNNGEASGYNLKYLDLSHNNIREAGFCDIVSTLKSSVALQTLNVNGNDLQKTDKKTIFSHLAAFLSVNKSC
jgi:Leucine-rich repeat (LRR) protein